MNRNLGRKQKMAKQANQHIVKLYEAWDRPEQASRLASETRREDGSVALHGMIQQVVQEDTIKVPCIARGSPRQSRIDLC